MPLTYDPIATTNITSTTNSVTFSSLGTAHTDLRIIVAGTTDAQGKIINARFNGDTGNNYKNIDIAFEGSTPYANNNDNYPNIRLQSVGTPTPPDSFTLVWDVFDYQSAKFKTWYGDYSGDINASRGATKCGGIWISTSAITSITIYTSTGGFAAGTNLTVYGIKAA